MNIKNLKKIVSGSTIGVGAVLAASALVLAATTYALFGDAQEVPGGNPGEAAQIRSDVAVAPGFGGVSVTPDSPISWADLDTLSLDFNVTDDDCGGGSPRVQVRVDTTGDGVSDGSVRIALGPSPAFTDCPTGWQSTGNLIGNEDAGRYDYSVFGGSPFTTYSNAPAAVQSGQVVGISVVVDSSWHAGATGGDGEQTVLVDNINLNGDVTTFDPEPLTDQDQCKNGGWEDFGFRNQGQCIRFVNTGQDSRL